MQVLLRVDSDERKRETICMKKAEDIETGTERGIWVSTQAGCKPSEVHLIEPKLKAHKT